MHALFNKVNDMARLVTGEVLSDVDMRAVRINYINIQHYVDERDAYVEVVISYAAYENQPTESKASFTRDITVEEWKRFKQVAVIFHDVYFANPDINREFTLQVALEGDSGLMFSSKK